MSAAATFAAVFVTLYAAHQVADHWVQTEHQAATKGQPGWIGRLACARHVATYTATAVVLLGTAAWLLDLPVTVLGVAAGQAVSAVTHYWADRRSTLRGLATACGHGPFYRLGSPRPDLPRVPDAGGALDATVTHDNPSLGTGAYALDQSWHYLWLWVASLLTALIGGPP